MRWSLSRHSHLTLMPLWFAFPRMLSVSWYIHWLFVLLLNCSVHLTIHLLICWFFVELVFLAPYVFWLLVPCLMYTAKDFLLFSRLCLQFNDCFLCCAEAFLMWCSPICLVKLESGLLDHSYTVFLPNLQSWVDLCFSMGFFKEIVYFQGFYKIYHSRNVKADEFISKMSY
jgi:hypothetical protein